MWSTWLPPLYCPENQFVDSDTCVNCPAGQSSFPGFNKVSCTNCSQGAKSGVVRPSECVCAGRYAQFAGQSCSPCPAGAYEDEVGSTKCKDCPSASKRNPDYCLDFPEMCVANSEDHCMCDKGSFMVKSDPNSSQFDCVKCPEYKLAYKYTPAAMCKGGHMKPFSKQKFWAPESRPLVSLVPLELRVCLNVSARLQEFRRCFFGDCLEGKEECYGYVDPTTRKPIYSEAGFELCDVGVKHSSVTLVRCSEGNSGTMCSQCKSDYFKGLPWEGQKCLECPSTGIGIFLYTFMPFFWVFLFFPGMRSCVHKHIH